MTTRSSPPEAVHVPFIAIALGVAILGGFLLAITLPLLAALGIPLRGWIPHAQVHGHLQTVGFVGLFLMGVAYRLVPMFAGRPTVRFPRLVPVSMWVVVTGVLLRAVGQPGAGHDILALLMAVGAWLECAGAASFAINIIATLRPFPRTDPAAPFFVAGVTWFLAQALLGGWWVSSAAFERASMIPAERDGLLVLLQLFGFHLMFILGVGVRSFPVFFAMPRLSAGAIAVPFAITQAGLAAVTTAGVIAASRSVQWDLVQNAGMLAVAVGVVWVAARTGWWRPPTRIRAASRPFAVTLQLALAWLTVACAIIAAGSLRALIRGTLPPWGETDAVRHIIAVGVILTTMVAMAQLVLPEFASERFAGRQGAWRGPALGGLLSLATGLRAGSRLLADRLPTEVMYLAMATSGVIALVVILIFAFLFARGVRHHRALQERFQAFAARGESWTLTPRVAPPDGDAR